MSLGERLLNLRKKKGLSQEEVADKLNVSRQTISKWETDQTTPDFDKIMPLCNLYGITSDELLNGSLNNHIITENKDINVKNQNIEKRARNIGICVILYFIAVAWIIVSIPTFKIDPILATSIFILICAIPTYLIIYTCSIYKVEKVENKEDEEPQNKLYKQIANVLSIITLIVYLYISFITLAWHITWIIWIVYGLVEEILKLIFMLRGNENEK